MTAGLLSGRLLLAAAAAGVIGATAALGVVWSLHELRPPPADLHDLLHRDIPLDAVERQRLDAKERAYDAHRRQIEQRMMDANGRLAAAIEADPRWSPQVEASTREVEAAAADLQRTTLEHVFEMRQGLEPDHRKAYDRALIDALKRGAR